MSIQAKLQKAKDSFINDTDIVFNDVTCKSYLKFDFPNGRSIQIKDPIYMATLPSGENLIYAADGISYKIRPSIGWWKTWETRKNCAHFVEEDIRAQKSQIEDQLLKS